jgi:acyl carrier protein
VFTVNKDEIIQKLTAVFRERFDNPNLVLSPEATAADIQGWDSLAHINLVLAVERAFSIRTSTRDVRGMKNVGDFIALLERKLG